MTRRRLRVVGGLALVLVWLVLGGPAEAGFLGPTPDGAGNWVLCNYRSTGTAVEFGCTYGIGPDGALPSAVTGRGSGAVLTCSGVAVAGEFRCSVAGPNNWEPDALTATYGGQQRQGQALRRTVYNEPTPIPGTHYRSGVTGVPASPAQLMTGPQPELVADAFGGVVDQVVAWAKSFAPAVLSVMGLAVGGVIVVGYLSRMHRSAAAAGDTGERGYLGDDGMGEDDSDQGPDSEDAEDDDGCDDEDELAATAGIEDETECVECGDELEFGWDGNYCEACGAKG